METIITNNGEFLYFTYENDMNNILFKIPVQRLAETQMCENKTLSKWIQYFLEKRMFSIVSLYRLAKYVQKYHPDNNINWEEQFIYVEREQHINTIINFYNMYDFGESSQNKNLIPSIDLSRESIQRIENTAKKNLRRFNVL